MMNPSDPAADGPAAFTPYKWDQDGRNVRLRLDQARWSQTTAARFVENVFFHQNSQGVRLISRAISQKSIEI